MSMSQSHKEQSSLSKSLNEHLEENPELKDQLRNMALGVNPETEEENPNFDYDSELPKVSILIPTYNRRNFLTLMLININNMDYPKDKLEVVIFDDHKINPLFDSQATAKMMFNKMGVELNYIYEPKRHLSIGEKRNKLVKLAKHKICINMDDDDIYFPTYVRYSVDLLIKNKAGLVGSPEMFFTFPHHDYEVSAIKCKAKRQIHEATMCFTKKHWRSMGGFDKQGVGEGSKMVDFNEKSCVMSDINKCMCCVVHQNNTVDKEQFRGSNKDVVDLVIPDIYKHLLDNIIGGIQYDNKREPEIKDDY